MQPEWRRRCLASFGIRRCQPPIDEKDPSLTTDRTISAPVPESASLDRDRRGFIHWVKFVAPPILSGFTNAVTAWVLKQFDLR